MKINWSTKEVGNLSPQTVGIFGLSCSSLGAIVLALSFTAGDGRQTSIISGIDYHIALISDIGFKIGFYLIILGFVFQIIEKIYEDKMQSISFDLLIITFLLSVPVYIFCIAIIANFLFI